MTDQSGEFVEVGPREMEFVGISDPESEFVGISDPESEFMGKLFCTHRLGDKWADLQPGDRISMVLPDRNERFGTAMVLAVAVGKPRNMIQQHCGLNHGCRQRETADRVTELSGILDGAYGKPGGHIFHKEGMMTVIYMIVTGRESAPAAS